MMALNGEITRQAAAIAYVDDFRLMMYVMLLAIPMLLLLRSPRRQRAATAAMAAE
jgi:MFS transporter, DHA2 family, multidrug resistance protein